MIRIPGVNLPPDAATSLQGYQSVVDGQPTYADRVAAAKERFSRENRRENPTFSAVRATLQGMCRGPVRCMYCEDSTADEIEHFRPKDLYPELVFVWENYLYACGPCNGPKNNRFQVFSARTGEVVEVSRRRNAPIVPPEPGDPMLIDPRREDPMDFLHLDLRGTFLFRESHLPGSREHERARYTIDVLHLNDRDSLRVARENAYQQYCAILHRYILQKRVQREQSHLDRMIRVARRMDHPAVWAEMKRQRDRISEVRALFNAAPEALDW